MTAFGSIDRASACGLMSCALLCACVGPSNLATASGDPTFLHCRDGRADFSISEHRRMIGQYSERTGRYVPLCRDCAVAEWDDRIVIHDSRGTYIAIDRISGEIEVQRGVGAGRAAARTYRGTCKLGARMGADDVATVTARAF